MKDLKKFIKLEYGFQVSIFLLNISEQKLRIGDSHSQNQNKAHACVCLHMFIAITLIQK
jgi:hypothetical protein